MAATEVSLAQLGAVHSLPLTIDVEGSEEVSRGETIEAEFGEAESQSCA